MNNLLYELYPIVFKDLNLKDLNNLRSTCRRLRNAVNDYKIKQLFINMPNSNQESYNELFTIDPDFKIQLDVSNPNGIRFFKNKILNNRSLMNLKFLQLEFKITNYDTILTSYLIKKFTKLDQLNIIFFKTSRLLVKKLKLVQQTIKTLNVLGNGIPITIDCNNLESISIDLNHQDVELFHITKITNLRICYDSDAVITKLLQFINLERITFAIYTFDLDLRNLLELTRLQEINLEKLHDDDSLFDENILILQHNSDTINEFLEYRNEQNKDNVILIICNRQINNSDDLKFLFD